MLCCRPSTTVTLLEVVPSAFLHDAVLYVQLSVLSFSEAAIDILLYALKTQTQFAVPLTGREGLRVMAVAPLTPTGS
jgi:hypothetical protein